MLGQMQRLQSLPKQCTGSSLSLSFSHPSCQAQSRRTASFVSTGRRRFIQVPAVVGRNNINVKSCHLATVNPISWSTSNFNALGCNVSQLEGKVVAAATRRSYTSSGKLFQGNYPPHTLYPLPALSPTMEVGTITSWNISEGESFSAGTSLCTIETDKASVDFEAQDDGILAKILKKAGPDATDIGVGTPICIVVDEVEDVAAFADYIEKSSPAVAAPTTDSATVVTSTSNLPVGSSILLPSARHLAHSKGYDATVLMGSAKGGRVTKDDVVNAIAAGSLPLLPTTKVVPVTKTEAAAKVISAPPAASPGTLSSGSAQQGIVYAVPDITGNTYNDVPNNKMRKIIASRLTASKREVPHSYTSMEIELDNIMALRKQLASQQDVKVSVNDFVIRCSALALRDVPEVNATYDIRTETIKAQNSIDISVAVATPTGLITPIVFNTDQLGLMEITNAIKDLASRAREGKLSPHEYQGGSFSVSNLGMFGIDEFSAVINPPQAAILAVGGGSKKVLPGRKQSDDNKPVPPIIRTIMTARLSSDRRVVDEATAALFMSALRQYMNQPELLLL